MTPDSDYLIVYGTLRPPFTNLYANYLRQHSQCVGEGMFPGQLFDLGSYPGAVYQPESRANVLGTIYNISDCKQQLLPYLDEYEGIGETFEQPQEYVRVVIEVNSTIGVIACWTYVYNLSVSDKRIITSGDYIQYVNK